MLALHPAAEWGEWPGGRTWAPIGMPRSHARAERTCCCEEPDGKIILPSGQSFLGHQERRYRFGEALQTIVITARPSTLMFQTVRFDDQLVYCYDEVDLTIRAVAVGTDGP